MSRKQSSKNACDSPLNTEVITKSKWAIDGFPWQDFSPEISSTFCQIPWHFQFFSHKWSPWEGGLVRQQMELQWRCVQTRLYIIHQLVCCIQHRLQCYNQSLQLTSPKAGKSTFSMLLLKVLTDMKFTVDVIFINIYQRYRYQCFPDCSYILWPDVSAVSLVKFLGFLWVVGCLRIRMFDDQDGCE